MTAPFLFSAPIGQGTPEQMQAALEAQDQQAEQQEAAEAARVGIGVDLLSRPLTTRDRESLAAILGSDFPLADEQPGGYDDWAAWAAHRWEALQPTVDAKMLLVDRNRRFREGQQWLSRQGSGPYKEPPMPNGAVRAVENVIAPALELTAQIIVEQRPGWRVKPTANTPERRDRATAQQQALEYAYDQQRMGVIISEAKYWAQTDGVSYLEGYWDPDAGPWQEVQVGEGSSAAQPLGDMRTRVRRIEQVRVSAEATVSVPPRYVMVQERVSLASMVARYGARVREAKSSEQTPQDAPAAQGVVKNGLERPGIDMLLRSQATTDRLVIYVERNEYLNRGLTLVVVGGIVVFLGPLIIGRIPVVAFRDGVTDPRAMPAPKMEMWLDCQQRLNMTKSKWLESLRRQAGGMLLGRERAFAAESISVGSTTIVPVRDGRALDDVVKPFPMTGGDRIFLEAYQTEFAMFEALSGWNSVARGNLPTDASGRAILSAREQLERVFAPDVTQAANAMVEWAMMALAFMRWGYDVPRAIGVEGEDRPDLGRLLSSEDFDGVAEVTVDPETMMPLPRTLRLYFLDEQLAKGAISLEEYRRRHPFGWTRQMETPDDAHLNRAKRVVDAIRQTGRPDALPILWQDNVAVHQDVLERDLILPDDTDPTIRWAAQQRWFMLAGMAEQQALRIGSMTPGGMPPGPGGSAAPAGMDPRSAPLAASNSGVATQPPSDRARQALRSGSDGQRLAGTFDGVNPR